MESYFGEPAQNAQLGTVTSAVLPPDLWLAFRFVGHRNGASSGHPLNDHLPRLKSSVLPVNASPLLAFSPEARVAVPTIVDEELHPPG